MIYNLSNLHLQTSGVPMWEHIYNIYSKVRLSWERQYTQGMLASIMNDFSLLRNELLELHCRMDIGNSFQNEAPTKDSENFP